MRFDHHLMLLWAGAGLLCSLSHTQVLHAEDTRVYETPQPRAPSTWQLADPEHPPNVNPVTLAAPDYTPLLIVSYLTAPVIGVGVTLGLAQFNGGQVTLVHVLLGMLGAGLAPALVHWFNDQTQSGFRALFGMPGLAIVGTIAGTLIAYLVLSIANLPPPDAENEGVREVAAFEIGLMVGAAAAISWAVFDVLDSAPRTRKSSRTASFSALRFAVVPTEHGAAGLLRFQF